MADETPVVAGLSEEETAAEYNGRVESFNKELIPLLKKYEIDLGATAFINPNGTIGAKPIVFDTRPKVAAPTSPEAPAEEAPTATAA